MKFSRLLHFDYYTGKDYVLHLLVKSLGFLKTAFLQQKVKIEELC